MISSWSRIKMKREGESQASVIPPVRRSKEKAKQFHGRISRFYDYVIGAGVLP